MNYKARLIHNGKLQGETSFESEPKDAYRTAHDGIDPLKGIWNELEQSWDSPLGVWVEIVPEKPEKKIKLNGK